MKFELKQLTHRINYLPHDPRTDRPILPVICGDHQSITIDAGNSSEHALIFLNQLKNNNILNIHSTILTHWHWDHSFGANQMNTFIIAHEETKRQLNKIKNYKWSDEALNERVTNGIENQFCADMIKKEYRNNRNILINLPNITFKQMIEIDLGGVNCIVKHVGGDHSSDSSIIYVEEEKTLFLGDSLYPSIYTKFPQYKVPNVRALIKHIEQFDADIYVLSHENPLSKDAFQGYINVLITMCNLIEKYQTKQILMEECSQIFNRELIPLEKEVLQCFINGLEN